MKTQIRIVKQGLITALAKVTSFPLEDVFDYDTMMARRLDAFGTQFIYLLKHFNGKKISLLNKWLQGLAEGPTYGADFYEITIKNLKSLTIDETTLNPICLKVNIANWKEEDFKTFIDKISKKNIYHLSLEGEPAPSCNQDILKNFIGQLSNVTLVDRVGQNYPLLAPQLEVKKTIQPEEKKRKQRPHDPKQKIKLKRLIYGGDRKQAPSAIQKGVFPAAEIQHVILEEEQQEEEQQQEQQLDHTLEQKLERKDESQTKTYDGELIDWQKFKAPPYFDKISKILWPSSPQDFYDALYQELGGIFPLSPDAAKVFADNPLDLATFNLNHLPAHFVRRKTSAGQWVTDYDLSDSSTVNVFTPKLYGQSHRSVLSMDYSGLSPAQTACLKQFLKNANCAHYDPADIRKAFDVFWAELLKLCRNTNVDIKKINASWQVPPYGNPVVFMDRLLTIFRNARNLEEQFACMDGLVLNRYGAYHASMYEGLKVVDSRMRFDALEAKAYDQLSFDPEARLHRVELETLKKYLVPQEEVKEEKWQPKQKVFYYEHFLPLVLRFMGQQLYGVKIADYAKYVRFIQGQDELKNKHTQGEINHDAFLTLALGLGKETRKKYHAWNSRMNYAIFISLFFLSHGRYQELEEDQHTPYDLSDLIRAIMEYGGENRGDLGEDITERLLPLYQSGAYLNNIEADSLFENLNDFANSNLRCADEHYSTTSYVKTQVNKLLHHLKNNKHGTLRLLKYRDGQAPSFESILMIEAYFAEDETVQSFYRDDLLLFSYKLVHLDDSFFTGTNKIRENAKKNGLASIREYLKLSAQLGRPNNIDYILKIIVDDAWSNSHSYQKVHTYVDIFKKVSQLKNYLPEEAERILLAINSHDGRVNYRMNKHDLIFVPKDEGLDQSDLRTILIEILTHPNTHPNLSKGIIEKIKRKALEFKDLKQLIAELSNYRYDQVDPLIHLFNKLKHAMMHAELAKNAPIGKLITNIIQLPEFNEQKSIDNLDKIKSFVDQTQEISSLLANIAARPNFNSYKLQFEELFKKINFSKLTYPIFFRFLNFMNSMPRRDYFKSVKEFVASIDKLGSPDHISRLLSYIEKLASHCSNEWLVQFMEYYCLHHATLESAGYGVIDNLAAQLIKSPKNELLKILLANNSCFSLNGLKKYLDLTNEIKEDKTSAALKTFFTKKIPQADLRLFFDRLAECKPPTDIYIFEMITGSYANTSTVFADKKTPNYSELMNTVFSLSNDKIVELYDFYKDSHINILTIHRAVTEHQRSTLPFKEFLKGLEKCPFDESRPLPKQFDVSSVERVINECKDLHNKSRYTWQYRKKLMEAFLFVNAVGNDLPLYHGKPARELSNAEIKSAFQSIKSGELDYLDTFQQGLYALALLREALYRTTGQFLYSTQMIALIDCLMAEGDVISNIDTGQGKTWIDTMKAVLLYSRKDVAAVDITTSSLDDAERDILRCGPFLSLLGIPYSEPPIHAKSEVTSYKEKGINYSTLSHLSLFRSRAVSNNSPLAIPNNAKPNAKICLVINEADQAILDDLTIYRLAVQVPGTDKEWVYEAVLDFIGTSEFTRDNTSEGTDLDNLRKFLKNRAKEKNHSVDFIDTLTDSQLLTWIESALLVVYKLQPDVDYVINTSKTKSTDEKPHATIKILSPEGEIQPDATYGNGIDSLLKVHLKKRGYHYHFDIKPESKTIIATNNKNLIRSYQATGGTIWGSSGTVGSSNEVKEQYENYGFNFSKIEPHQKSRIEIDEDIEIREDKETWARFILSYLYHLDEENRINNTKQVVVVFFENIKKLKWFEEQLKDYEHLRGFTGDDPNRVLQVYTGSGNRADAIQKARHVTHFTLTLTTSVLGRNADIVPDDPDVPLTVVQTFPDSERGDGQKKGRTGRNGARGKVKYIFNQEDFDQEIHSMEPEQKTSVQSKLQAFRQTRDEKSAHRRQFNEELYDFIDELFSKIRPLTNDDLKGTQKSDLIKKQWAFFNEKTESIYRKQKSRGTYDRDTFRDMRRKKFKQIFNEYLKVDLSEEKKQNAGPPDLPVPYLPFADDVRISDCVLPATIAYQFLPPKEVEIKQSDVEDKQNQDIKDEINRRLTHLFNRPQNFTLTQLNQFNQEYFCYLNENVQSLNIIRQTHQEFLHRFFSEKTTAANQKGFFQRWAGHGRFLKKITNDTHYLLTFSALCHLQGSPLMQPKDLAVMITALLDQYLNESWFINKTRSDALDHLKEELKGITDFDGLISAIAKTRSNLFANDIQENKSCFRRIKPINFFGSSRCQQTLSGALRWVQIVANKQKMPNTDYIASLKTIVKDEKMSKGEGFTNKDHFLTTAHFLKQNPRSTSDKSNMKVALENLEKDFSIDDLQARTKKLGKCS